MTQLRQRAAFINYVYLCQHDNMHTIRRRPIYTAYVHSQRVLKASTENMLYV